MSSIPGDIDGIGSTEQKIRPNPGFNAMAAGISPEEYFVWSRFDGATSLREVLLTTGLPPDKGVAIAKRLRQLGAVLLPGEKQPPKPAPRAAGPAQASKGASGSIPLPKAAASGAIPLPKEPTHLEEQATVRRPALDPASFAAPAVRVAELDLSLPNMTPTERAAMAEPCDLVEGERRRILAMFRLVKASDPWALLGVARGAEPREIKRTYFRLTKDVHPDRYYGKQLGSFGETLAAVFGAVTNAYTQLTSKQPVATPSHAAQVPQTPAEYAAELFDRACTAEHANDADGAMKLFSAAVRLDGQLRYVRRAATCALLAKQPKSAVEYAKKAIAMGPSDPSNARLLAQCFRACGQLEAAEEVLIMAMALPHDNDVLHREMDNELAKLRAQLAR